MPPRLAFKRFTCFRAQRGGVWIPCNSGYTHTHTETLHLSCGEFRGRVDRGSAAHSMPANVTIWITGRFVAAEPSGRCGVYDSSWGKEELCRVSYIGCIQTQHKLAHGHRKLPPRRARVILSPESPSRRVRQSQSAVICPGPYKQQHSWKKPKPSMSRSSLLTTVSEELWCAL